MEANIWGFKAQSSPCEFGTCDLVSECSRNAWDYGPADGYTIDSSKAYHVRTEFWTMAEDYQYTELY